MATNSFLSLGFNPISTSRLLTPPPPPPPSPSPSPFPLLLRTHLLLVKNRHIALSLPRPRASSSSSSIDSLQAINVDYLEQEFSGHGVTFEGIGDSCVAKLCLENGSSATLLMPSGLVTSYKAPMWHGEVLELLQTFVAQGEDGEASIQGGISMELNFEQGEDNVIQSPRNWLLSDIRGNPQDYIEVELISSDSGDNVEVKYILTLAEQRLTSKIKVLNSTSSPLRLTGSIVSNVCVSTPDATYAIGLAGSDYYKRPPLQFDNEIIPPTELKNDYPGLSKIWGKMQLKGKKQDDEEMEGEEDDNYKRLTEEMSLFYTSAPTYLTIIDRGRRNSVIVGREGFDEVYIHSPGSKHEFYTKYCYICIGPTAILKPRIVGPHQAWTGLQTLNNPNL